MKVKELDRQVMLEFIEHKYQELKSNIIRINENDLNYYSDDIVDILLDLEKSSKGKIKLTSVNPKNDRPESYTKEKETEDNLFSFKKKYPDYFYINYEPLAISMNKNGKEEILTLSKNKGLCRIIDGKTVCYPISGDRYKILFYLGKNYSKTEDLADSIESNAQNIRTQIGSIRKQIEKNLSLNGDLVIENSKTGNGYRIGKTIKIIKDKKI